ncbi:MAG: thiamine pyrophosphate-binding protein [Alphaproteobacteria bacterium]|nr:thiamine pyrophosphate-binding protein [Alphaproteobacteria bacterium]
MPRTGGDALVDTLIAHGIDAAFGVAGESYLAVLEAMRRNRNAFRWLPCRHESGGAFAADAYARFTRRPGLVMVTRGPGAGNAAVAMHSAAQDSIPLVMAIGHVPTRDKGLEAFQEIDYHQMFGKIAKAVIEPEAPDLVGASTARALRLAVAGRPGPVVLVLPRDVTEGDAGDKPLPRVGRRAPAGADPAALAEAATLLRGARAPMILVGELVNWEQAQAEVVALAEALGAGVMAAYRCAHSFPSDHPAYLGHIELNGPPYQKKQWAEADVVLALGTRLDGATAGRHTAIRPDQALVHVYPDPTVLARFTAAVPMLSDVKPAVAALRAALAGFAPPPDRLAWRQEARARHERFVTPGDVPIQGAVDMARVVAEMGRLAPADATVVTDSGTFARWVHRYHPYARPDTQAGSAAGSMGYAVPGAVGAQLARPGKTVIAVAGDGGFQMTGQELMTAVDNGLPIKVIVADNGVWGSIMQSQRGKYGAEGAFGTTLAAPDFVRLAEGYGAAGFRVERTEEFAPAFAAALKHDGPALVHVKTDPRDITPFGPWDP